jgi:O-antigen/teichoic acid export membrane protein
MANDTDTETPPVAFRIFRTGSASRRGTAAIGLSALAILTLLASAMNYASSIVFSRVLSPVGFGDLTAMLALGAVIAVPTTAAQTVIAERVAVHVAGGRMDNVRYLIRHGFAHILVLALLGTAVYVLCIPLVVRVFSLRVPGPAIALTGVVFCGFLLPFALGILQGLNRLVLFGLLLVAISTARIVFGVGWAALDGGAGGAIGGQALGMAGVLALSAWMLRDVMLRRGSGAATAGLRRKPDTRTVTASAAFVAFAVISNLDLLLAKIFLPGHDAGIYAAMATVGKVVTFLPAAVAVAMVPNAARAHLNGESRRVLRHSAVLVAGAAGLAAVPTLVAPRLVVDVMFGSGYEQAADALAPMVIAGAALAMLNLLVVYSVAIRDQRWPLLLLVGVGIQVSGVSLFHDSPGQVALVQATAALTVLGLNELISHSLVRPEFRRAWSRTSR